MKIDLLLTPRRATEVWMEHRDNSWPRISAFSTKGIFELDQVGYELWSLLDGQRTVENTIGEIARRYPNQPRAHIQEDICGFIEDLSDCGLVKLDYWSLTRTIEAAQRGRLPITSSLVHSGELQVLLIVPPSSSLLSNTIVSAVSTIYAVVALIPELFSGYPALLSGFYAKLIESIRHADITIFLDGLNTILMPSFMLVMMLLMFFGFLRNLSKHLVRKTAGALQ